VKRACLFQANDVLDGSRRARQDARHDGLLAQSVGGLSEQYLAQRGVQPLCRPAAQLMAKYRVQAGRIL
jgi:hypothetical protein